MKEKTILNVVKLMLGVLMIILVVIQFFKPQKNLSEAPYEQLFKKQFNVDEQVNSVLAVSCYDCHSNNTKYTWYSEFQPMAWLMNKHIKEGKEKLNFDELHSLSDRRLRSKVNQIIEQVQQNKMPLNSYRWMHKEAELTVEDKERLIQYFNGLNTRKSN